MEKPPKVRENKLEDLQKAGVEAYRKRDFKAALEHFTAALSRPESWAGRGLSNPKSYELFNLRAAVYEKMDGKLEEAANDAKKMIRLDKKSVPGYLRAGKVLGLMGKWEAALRMYRYGLERVPQEDNERKVLVGMCEKVEARVEKMRNDAKRTDPLSALPLELVDLIMLMTDFRSMIRCQRVCKSWRDFFRNYYYHTYRKLDFFHAVTAPKEKTLDKYINLSRLPGRDPIEEITFSHFFTRGNDMLVKKCISECPSLHTLKIPRVLGMSVGASCFGDGQLLQTLVLGCRVDIEDLAGILQASKRLQRLECHSVRIRRFISGALPWWYGAEYPNLEVIVLKLDQEADLPRVSDMRVSELEVDLPRAMPNLRSFATTDRGPVRFFHLLDFTSFQHLEQFLSHNEFGIHFPYLPQSITSLTIRGNHLIKSTSIPLPNLHTLSISENNVVTNGFISSVLSYLRSPSPLRVLNLSQCSCIEAAELSWLLAEGHCDYLEELYLEGLSGFGDQVTREMGCLGWLKGLDISRTRVTGVGLMNIVNGVGRKRAEKIGREKGVEWVKIVMCDWVGLDAIELARKLGVKVTYVAPKLPALRERRVRYGYT
ncbi:hypothetical protein EV426DRAFT_383769 [Tirmania nivea]|nr:hypothetical protein EV426DRAFT_383769 [Tirmania nivea]